MSQEQPFNWRDGYPSAESPAPTGRGAGGGLNLGAMGWTPVLTLACHPDTHRLGQSARLPLLVRGDRVALSRMHPDFVPPGGGPGQPLLDTFVSRNDLWLEVDGDDLWVDSRESNTEVALRGRLVQGRVAVPIAELQRGVTLKIADRVLLLIHLASEPHAATPSYGLVGDSDALQQVRVDIRFAAEDDGGVLVVGEAGSGKETVVRAIRDASRRADGPYQYVNAAAVPPQQLQEVLFGGGKRPKGVVHHADGGILHIAEIGELSPRAQAWMLQLAKEGRVVGDDGEVLVSADVRLVGSTDAVLATSVVEGQFSAELLELLEANRVRVPPLRERLQDIPLILLNVLSEELTATGELDLLDDPGPGVPPWLPADMMQRLLDYEWPSNVRQLITVARSLVSASRGAFTARSSALVERFLPPPADLAMIEGLRPPATDLTAPEDISQADLIAALRAYRWSAAAAGRHLGVSKNTIYQLMDACPDIAIADELEDRELLQLKRQYRADVHLMAEALEMSRRGLQRRMWALDGG